MDANGELNVGAAAAAIADPGTASAEPAQSQSSAAVAAALIASSLSADPSGEPSGDPSGDNDKNVVVIGGVEYVLEVYVIDGVEYVKLSDLAALGADGAAEGDWGAYQEYLIEAAGGNAPDLDEFKAQVYAIHSWDEMPLDESPWDMLFTMVGVSTYEQFLAGARAQSQVEGAMG